MPYITYLPTIKMLLPSKRKVFRPLQKMLRKDTDLKSLSKWFHNYGATLEKD